jgi:hypothetical protein
MRTQITRFTCDNPDCDDVVDVPLPPDSPVLIQMGNPSMTSLPDGWIEFTVAGSSSDGQDRLVHASRPECAAKLAEDQANQAATVAEERAQQEEQRRKDAEEATKAAEEAAAAQEDSPLPVAEGEET